MPRRSVVLFAGACVAIAAALAVVTTVVVTGREQANALQPSATGQAMVGGPFQLVDQNGRAVDQSLLNGKWSLIFFGFTYCPDYCPSTLATMTRIQQLMGDRAPQMIFVSVDPERDTPQALRTYLSSEGFPQGVIGLTGSRDQVDGAAKAYRVFYEKVGEGEGYTMNHSLNVYLMGPDGKFRAVVADQLGPERATDIIRAAMSRG